MRTVNSRQARRQTGTGRGAGRQTVLVLLSVLAVGCERSAQQPGEANGRWLEWRGETMGTDYRIQLRAGRASKAPQQGEVDALLEAINASMSTWQPDSELMRFNRAPAGEEVTLSAELFRVLDCAQRIARSTEGAFDVTMAPLLALWGFGAQGAEASASAPEASAIAAARKDTGYQLLQLNAERQSARRIRPGVFIDLSGIAKGYAVDRIADYLAARGSSDFLVEIGGEIRTRGVNAAGQDWRIGVEHPRAHQAAEVISLSDMGMATSGDYRNFRRLDGIVYPHIIDPASGWPVQHPLASVSVLHASAMQADALATALMVMGRARALRFSGEHRLAVLLISDESTLRRSPALSRRAQGASSFCPQPGRSHG